MGLSVSNLVTTSFAKSIGMDGKDDMTSNDTIHSSGSMDMPCIWFMNAFASINAYGDWRLRCFNFEKSHLDNLNVGDPIRDTMILRVFGKIFGKF